MSSDGSVRCSTCRSSSCCPRTAGRQIARRSSACFPERRRRDSCGRLLQLRRLAWASVPECLPTRSSDGPSIYIWVMRRQVDWHRVRVGLVVALIIIFVGVVIDSLFSTRWALDDGLLLAAAAVIALALLVTRGRGRSEAR